jgi:hypothetical protein
VTANEFYIEEYKALRAELSTLIAETRKIELAVAVATAAVYSWLAAAKIPPDGVWFIPCAFVVLGALRSIALFIRIGEIARYLRAQEDRFQLPGWETHKNHGDRAGFSVTALVFWIAALVVTVVAAVSLPRLIPPTTPENAVKAHNQG